MESLDVAFKIHTYLLIHLLHPKFIPSFSIYSRAVNWPVMFLYLPVLAVVPRWTVLDRAAPLRLPSSHVPWLIVKIRHRLLLSVGVVLFPVTSSIRTPPATLPLHLLLPRWGSVLCVSRLPEGPPYIEYRCLLCGVGGGWGDCIPKKANTFTGQKE